MSRRPKMQQHGTRALSVRERAYIHIQRLIADGTLAAGGGVSELVLAKELGSSRTPIREAMNQLAAEGLLSQSAAGGMTVSQLQREDIIELYELREALEVYAVRKISRIAMLAADKDRLQYLVDQIAQLRMELEQSGAPTLDGKQMERFIGCDFNFHALLMSMARNSRLQKILNETRLLISIFAIHRKGHGPEALHSILQYHQRILDAVVEQAESAAASALAEHIQASQGERLNEYDHWKRENSLRHSMPIFLDIHQSGHAT
jgi:DNA-binding GntR family transcriptional regulator